MQVGYRPGGMTVMAVLNFILGGWYLLSFLSNIVSWALVRFGRDSQFADNLAKALEEQGITVDAYLTIALLTALWHLAAAPFLVVSGVGYIRQSRLWGRWVGNGYGLIGLLAAIVFIYFVAIPYQGGVNLGTLHSLFYPVFTLFLLNVVFRRDFIR